MSVLQQIHKINSLALSTVSEDGPLRHEGLTRLPKPLMSVTPTLAKESSSSSTTSTTDETFMLVWNTTSAMRRYSFGCIDTIFPPLLMERRKVHISMLPRGGFRDKVLARPLRGIYERPGNQTRQKRWLAVSDEGEFGRPVKRGCL